MEQHLEKFFPGSFTSQANDWKYFYVIPCENHNQALSIEKHLKRMKSKIYLENLKKYPEMVEKLLNRYKL